MIHCDVMGPPTERVQCSYWDYTACEGTPHCPPRCPRFVDGTGVPIIIRRYEDGDFDGLETMYEQLGPSNRTMGVPPLDSDRLTQWLRTLTDDGWNLVALHDDRVVGHVGVGSDTKPDPDFVVFVHDDHQGRGVGTELVKHVIANAADQSHDALTLDVLRENERAVAVYRKLGFEVTEEQAMEFSMRLSLEAPVAKRVQRPPAER